jgi:hypothetical protein
MSRFDNMQAHALDGWATGREGAATMTRTPLILALGAAAALAGCNKESHTIVGGGDPRDENSQVASNGPVALPPSVTSSKIYRCADNQVVYVDWLSDNLSANIRTEQGGTPTHVVTAEAGKPMTAAGGYSISDTPGASSAKIAIPGHGAQSCQA